MKLLMVANSYSVHTARWVSQLSGLGWDIHVFDPNNGLVNPALTGVTLHTGWRKPAPSGVTLRYRWPFSRGRHLVSNTFPSIWKKIVPDAPLRLAQLIEQLKPNCIHSPNLLSNGRPVADAKRILGEKFSLPWIYSSQGSDIYYYRDDPQYHAAIKDVVQSCDYYTCNCKRDLDLAYEWGFKGEFLGYFQGGGGYPIEVMLPLRQNGATSSRKVIALKGRDGGVGRARVGIQALLRCANLINERGFQVVIYQAHQETEDAAVELSRQLHNPVQVVPRSEVSVIWKLMGQARVSLGVNVSDGVPNTMIESMIMGAFPIQTDPGGATSEWLEHSVNGFTIPPEDPDIIAEAIVEALTNDELVDRANSLNWDIVRERIDDRVVKPKVISMYRRVMRGQSAIVSTSN
jgi:glycosyltransferase involved in cell wall biosynthesis